MSSEERKSLEGFRLLFSLQFITKISTFICNLYLNRRVSLTAFGRIQDYDLFYSFLLFLSRETFRLAILRSNSFKLSLNLSMVPLVIVLLGSGSVTGLDTGYRLYYIGGLLEVACEVFYCFCQFEMLYEIRVLSEGLGFLLQNLYILVFVFFSDNAAQFLGLEAIVRDDYDVLVYASSQVVYGLVLAASFYCRINNHLKSKNKSILQTLKPQRELVHGKLVYFDLNSLKLATSFLFQSVVKHLLTVGDKLILSTLGLEYHTKGAFRIVSDLGSLVARILFLPMEDASRVYFSKKLVTDVKGGLEFLHSMMQFHVIFGSFFVFFGSNYTRLLLSILYSKSNDELVELLSCYCLYVPVLGLNGITEAFLQASGSTQLINKQTIFMVFLWIVYVSSSYLFVVLLDLSSKGLVYANILTMVLRILFSLRYIQSQFNQSVNIFSKSLALWDAFGLSWLITFYTKDMNQILHLVVGVVCFLVVLGIIYKSEKQMIRRFTSMYASPKTKIE